MKYVIRRRRKEDCLAIAHVVTISWNETYKGIVPDWFLDKLKTNEEERANRAMDSFEVNNNHQFVLEIDNKVVGFINLGIALDNDFENCGEVIAFYIIGKYQKNGFGRKLIEEGIKELKSLGCDKMIIACLKGNSTNDFYKHIGGVYIKDGMYERLSLPENIYYYEI